MSTCLTRALLVRDAPAGGGGISAAVAVSNRLDAARVQPGADLDEMRRRGSQVGFRDDADARDIRGAPVIERAHRVMRAVPWL